MNKSIIFPEFFLNLFCFWCFIWLVSYIHL